MSGFESKRFIDLSEREARHLSCGICLNIFNNAIDSDCGHTFCKNCIQEWILKNHKECPKCRSKFRRQDMNERSTNNLLVIDENVFTRNLMANAFISEMKIKCNFEDNGCQQVVTLGSLFEHIKNCEYRFCKVCGMSAGSNDEHNCLQLMKNDRNLWKLKYEKVVRNLFNIKSMVEKQVKVYEELLEMVWNRFSLNNYLLCEQIMFGTHLVRNLLIDVNQIGICFEPQSDQYFAIDYEAMNELMFCSEATLSMIIVRPEAFVCQSIKERTQFFNQSMGRFDVESDDHSEGNIILYFKSQTVANSYWMTLRYYSFLNNKALKCEQIDKVKAKQLIDKVNCPGERQEPMSLC